MATLWAGNMQPQPGPYYSRPGSSRPTSSSETSSQQQKKRVSANRVKARPANPAVISGILDSLDTLTRPTPSLPPEEASTAESISERASLRPYSADGTVRSMQTLNRSVSPGFGTEYGRRVSQDEDEGVTSDAALPPTIRTSRPPSGLSMYNAQRTPSFTGVSPILPGRTPSLRSRGSSYSSTTKEKTGYSRNKLSSESWVRQGQDGPESPQAVRERSIRSVRRVESQDSLRQGSIGGEPASGPSSPAATLTPTLGVSRAEQIIAKATTPPLSSARRRLYLTDPGSSPEEPAVFTPPPIEEDQEPEDDSLTPSPWNEQEDQLAVKRSSPPRNAIVDSIPMRTSSLRQSHSNSPVRGKKKERKSSRTRRPEEKGERMLRKKKSKLDETSSSEEALASRKVDSVVGAQKSIPESSWADLPEEDDTVRRIRQLQEQRKSRLLETSASWSPEEVTAMANQMPVIASPLPRPNEERKLQQQLPRQRPMSGRGSTEPPVKAHKLLGITAEEALSLTPISAGSPNNSARRNLSLDEYRLELRPGTSTLPTPPLSLDYSYSEAVDALRGAEREVARANPARAAEHSRQPSVRTSEQLPRIAKQFPGTQVNLVPAETSTPEKDASTPTSLRLSKSQRRTQQDRWTHYHPDLPLDFERKKNRRKSTSDARNTRQYADVDGNMPLPSPVPVPRRDSIEVAVTDYLHHNRLSRKVRHPLTGRIISFSEVGDRNGAAVFMCVGMGLTRYVSAFYDELATTLRLRLITIDRPGVGGSEPYPPNDRSGPLNWPDDLMAVCQALDISRFSMIAHSAGAIYTLATALTMPHMIHGKIHLLAPCIPPSQLGAVSRSTSSASAAPAGALPRSQRFLRVLPTSFFKAANSSFMTATSASLKPATKRSRSRGGHGDSPARPATRDGGTDFARRESMMLMDQFMPDSSDFPLPSTANGDDTSPLSRQPSIIMSATATPMDPSFTYAANALNAAEHTEKERKTEYTSRLTQRTWELAVRDSNPATDLLICLERQRDIGFRYTDVECESVVTHGSEDKRVPVGNVRWLVEQMNRKAKLDGQRGNVCELRVLEGEGHGLMASPIIMGDVLTEVAGYWAKGR